MARLLSWLPLACLLLAFCPLVSCGSVITVSDDTELLDAIDNASPGDVIEIPPGVTIALSNVAKIRCNTAGTPTSRITVRGSGATSAITMDYDASGVTEGFFITAPYWTFENFTVTGLCSNNPKCAHAFHIVGDADFTILRNLEVVDFDAQLKSNIDSNTGEFPDDCLIELVTFYDTAPRVSSAPVNKLNIDGGDNWLVRQSYFGDAQKDGGNGISYLAYMKSNGANGVFEQNVIVCSNGKASFTGGVRRGLSFGGGGTSQDSVCGLGTCTPEHRNGTMRNNIIMNCNDNISDDGIYLNEARDTKIYNNLLYNTNGMDLQFIETNAFIVNNIIGGGTIFTRNNATVSLESSNWITDTATLEATFSSLDFNNANFLALTGSNEAEFIDAGEDVSDAVVSDFCGSSRPVGSAYDIGPVEYDLECDVSNSFGAFAQPTSGGNDASDGDDGDAASAPGSFLMEYHALV